MVGRELELKVKEALQSDVGRGIARVDSASMEKLGVETGDVVEVEGAGGKKAAALVWRARAEDEGKGTVRLDGIVRHNIGASVDDIVKVRKAEVRPAKEVHVAPTQEISFREDFVEYFHERILNAPLITGNSIVLEVMGRPLVFNVIATNPKGIVQVSPETKLKIATKPVKVTLVGVRYEDIGGLKEEIDAIREMVEIPMKHPEVFKRLGISPPKGVLLYGPPGCGKTLLAKAVASESEAHFIALNGPEIMCVGPETPILTWDGIRTAKEVFEQIKHECASVVRTSRRETFVATKPMKIFSMSPDMKIETDSISEATCLRVEKSLRIRTAEGTELTVSQNQPFAVLSENGLLTWKTAGDINPGEFVAAARQLALPVQRKLSWCAMLRPGYTAKLSDGTELPLLTALKEFNGSAEDHISGLKYSGEGNPTRNGMGWMRPVSQLTPEFGRFLGLLFSGGGISSRMDEVTIANNDPHILNEVRALSTELFGLAESSITIGKDRAHIFDQTVCTFLCDVCGVPSDWKRGMRAPDFLYFAPDETVASFIAGYVDGNGCIDYGMGHYPSFVIYSSRSMLSDIQSLLQLRFGVPSRIRRHATRIPSPYALTVIGSKGRRRFLEKIMPFSLKKAEWRIGEGRDEESFVPFAGRLLRKAKEKLGIKYGKDIRKSSIEPYLSERKKMTERKAREIIRLFEQHGTTEEISRLKQILASDIRFVEVGEVEENGPAILYDFGITKNSNFLGGRPFLVLHNSKWYGQSEENLRKVFDEAKERAPTIIFMDEIDAIAPKREEVSGEVERRVVSQLLTLMDGLEARGDVIVIAATNRPDSIDSALRRPGRFDREIEIRVPDKQARREVFQIHTRGMPLAKDVNLDEFVEVTHGFTGADVAALCREAAMRALRRMLPEIKGAGDSGLSKEVLSRLTITRQDFIDALKKVEPSAMREVQVEIPRTRWDEIGGLEEVKAELREAVEWPLKYPDTFARLGITPPKGILLLGPPGCGKTMLARAVATEANANFISIKGPAVISKWVGESERAIREIFKRARQVSPAIIFFDELDSIASTRGAGIGAGAEVSERVVDQLLVEMDGLEELHQVVVIAATNRPDRIDPGLLRPGRFDKLLYVPVPDEKSRREIFGVCTKKMPLSKDVDLEKLVARTANYTGADIAAVCKEAGMFAVRENKQAKEVAARHFELALGKVKPYLTEEEARAWEEVRKRYTK